MGAIPAQLPRPMAEIDDELVARAIRWCAEAGRHASAGEVRAALGSLSWDQLLAARALLADPPPARPLGPAALADVARGAPADAAAEREREGRYRREELAGPEPSPAPPARATRRSRPAARTQPVIRRARDRAADVPAAPPAHRLLDELYAPEGRGTLEALLRRRGPIVPLLLEELASGWRRGDGLPPEEAELRALMSHHGLHRAFARHEREALLHAVRTARGVKRRAAAGLGISLAALEALLERSGAAPQIEELRQRRRTALRRQATLSERAQMLLGAREELEDLDLLAEVEGDLARRLPDHLRALEAAGSGPLEASLSRSLSLPRADVDSLLARLRVALPAAALTEHRAERRTGRPTDRRAERSPARSSGSAAPRSKAAPRRPRGPSGPRRPRPL